MESESANSDQSPSLIGGCFKQFSLVFFFLFPVHNTEQPSPQFSNLEAVRQRYKEFGLMRDQLLQTNLSNSRQRSP